MGEGGRDGRREEGKEKEEEKKMRRKKEEENSPENVYLYLEITKEAVL